MIERCFNCHRSFDPDQSGGIQSKESGKWLCPECKRSFNYVASRIMVHAFLEMDDLLRQSFADDQLPGWGDFEEEVRNELQK